MKTQSDFRRYIREQYPREKYPRIKLIIRTVSFADLARAEKKFACVTGIAWTPETWNAAHAFAKECGVILSVA